MSELDFSDNSLCLEFANTWEDRSDSSSDTLDSYEDLLAWSEGVGIVSDSERRHLGKLARMDEAGSSAVLRKALEFRDTVFALCSAAAAGRVPPEEAVANLNTALETMPRRRLCYGGPCCEWVWPEEDTDLGQVLWPVIRSTAELVTSADVSRIRECAAPDCNWLFLDFSRGNRRRWCDMATCGNRAKARRYYERHRRNI